MIPIEPILILSDLHLGHRASLIEHPDQLASLLHGPGSVIFNGDTAEMRNSEDRVVGRKLAADLARVCHQAGRKAFFVNGNHDPTVSNTNHLDLERGAILVTHGDILFFGPCALESRSKALPAETPTDSGRPRSGRFYRFRKAAFGHETPDGAASLSGGPSARGGRAPKRAAPGPLAAKAGRGPYPRSDGRLSRARLLGLAP